jgi:N-acetylmuramoyl-L-alanine amidase
MTVHKFPHSVKSTKLAEAIKYQFGIFCASQRQRGIKNSNFYVLQYTKMPAVLCECEFLSSPVGRKFIVKPENQKRVAVAIARGINNYYN